VGRPLDPLLLLDDTLLLAALLLLQLLAFAPGHLGLLLLHDLGYFGFILKKVLHLPIVACHDPLHLVLFLLDLFCTPLQLLLGHQLVQTLRFDRGFVHALRLLPEDPLQRQPVVHWVTEYVVSLVPHLLDLLQSRRLVVAELHLLKHQWYIS
jgi:hypothetical protein